MIWISRRLGRRLWLFSAILETGGKAWASRGRGERAGAAVGLLSGCCQAAVGLLPGGIIVTIIAMA